MARPKMLEVPGRFISGPKLSPSSSMAVMSSHRDSTQAWSGSLHNTGASSRIRRKTG